MASSEEKRESARARSRIKPELMVSIASVLIAAFGAIFAYYQVEIIKRERLTPYRAIVYSQRVDSYRQIVRSHEDLSAVIAPTDLVEYERMRQRPDFLARAATIANQYRQLLRREIVIWPSAVQRSFGEAQRQAATTDMDIARCQTSGAECMAVVDREFVELAHSQEQLLQALADSMQLERLESIPGDA